MISKINIRLVSSKSGKVIFDQAKKSSAELVTTRVAEYSYSDKLLRDDPVLIQKSVIKTSRMFLADIVKSIDKIAWEGSIALVNGEKIYINAGRLSGLQIGDILKVTEKGPEVYDPDTGRYIGNAPGRMKGRLEVVSYFGKDGAITIVYSGSGFTENDRVELY